MGFFVSGCAVPHATRKSPLALTNLKRSHSLELTCLYLFHQPQSRSCRPCLFRSSMPLRVVAILLPFAASCFALQVMTPNALSGWTNAGPQTCVFLRPGATVDFMKSIWTIGSPGSALSLTQLTLVLFSLTRWSKATRAARTSLSYISLTCYHCSEPQSLSEWPSPPPCRWQHSSVCECRTTC